MTEILQSPSPLPSSPSSITRENDGPDALFNSPTTYSVALYRGEGDTGGGGGRERKRREREEGDQLSLVAVVATVLRKSLVGCRSSGRVEDFSSMEIGVPTDVRHVAHVTFDRFNGFLGLPVEFEPEVPRRPPSASTSVFGVSTESMQLSFDSRGNSVPTILLMMQRRLYAQGGLQAEGIFRINAENSQEEYVREQLNHGIVPDNMDMHCLAGLIKAWFRELPNGLLDSLSPEDVMQAQSEQECARLVRQLPPTEASLLDWAINLMADVAQLESANKMNSRNVAMVFAPNMTQMADPLTALMYAVQVMNFLRTLIDKTLREREETVVDQAPPSQVEPSDENGHHSSQQPLFEEVDEVTDNEERVFLAEEPSAETPAHHTSNDSNPENDHGFLTSIENIFPGGKVHLTDSCPREVKDAAAEEGGCGYGSSSAQNTRKKKTGQSSSRNLKKTSKKGNDRATSTEKNRGTTIISRLNSRTTDRIEAWR
ncbi:rho GTPase-activating protein 5-like [Diospyros lotus]|uniref:rho GTPase-activating protein 5-like n=1 Tax=Diospyros lotus TaxID=55363 RepID=UPI00224F5434|nr:rho GTPase-activating protein 5-like [Diospyros lotus]